MTEGRNENEDLRVIDHVLKFHFSKGSPDGKPGMPLAEINKEIDMLERKERARRLRRLFYPVAAAIAVLVAAGAILFNISGNDICRYVNDGEVAFNIALPDGTKVWINPGTVLAFDRHFNDGERRVTLSGEAYFDVAHNPECPFIVSTDRFGIKVLGTVFNVKAQPDDKYAEVSLAQGAVAMQNADGVELVRLRPGQQAIFDNEQSSVEIRNVHVGDMLMKHYGVVSLQGATVFEILDMISGIYGIRIEASAPDDTTTYNFCFQKDSDIHDVLSILRFVCKRQEFTIYE